MDNFIANLKSRLMLPGAEEKSEPEIDSNPVLVPMPEVEKIVPPTYQEAPAPEVPAPEVPAPEASKVSNDPPELQAPEKMSSKTNLSILAKTLNPFQQEKKQEEPEPAYVPNPIEDDIFIYYD